MKHVLLVVLILLLLPLGAVFAADDENCILCHKYRGLSRVDKQGDTRLFYVNEGLYTSSVHGKVKCTECHAQITKIPHEEDTKVSCLNECHIVEPTSDKRFSHKSVMEEITNSIHNPDSDYVRNKDKVDFPTCVNCHTNPMFKPIQIFKEMTSEGQSPKALARCNLCHEEKSFIKYFYNHVSHRLHTSRSSKEILRMCENCHAQEDMAKKHKLNNAMATYEDSFHGKAVKFGSPSAPNCIDCHVKESKSAHAIKSYKDPESAVHKDYRWKTCAKSGCHPKAGEGLGNVRMHVAIDKELYPMEYYTALGFTTLTLGAFFPLMLVVILELIREIFPNLSLRRRRKK